MANTKRGNLKTMFSVPEGQDKTVADTVGQRPDRVGKKQTIFHMPEAAKKQLAILAIEGPAHETEKIVR